MAGIGAGCKFIERESASCLKRGRIGVWAPDANNSTQSGQKRHSCSYRKGITSGILCCKRQRKAIERKLGTFCTFLLQLDLYAY